MDKKDVELKKLILRLNKDRKEEDFRLVYELTYQKLFYSIDRKIGNKEEAKEIMQFAYMQAFTKLGVLDEPANFEKWLHGIANNKCIDFLKKKKMLNFSDVEQEEYEIEVENTYEDYIPDKKLEIKELKKYVSAELDKLPTDQKVCLIMYYFEELKISEIAKLLECSEATVKSRMKYGKEKLAISIGEYQKKNDIKLYSASVIPILLLCFQEDVKQIGIDYAAFTSFASSQGMKTVTKIGKNGLIQKLFSTTFKKAIIALTCITTITLPIGYKAIEVMNESKNVLDLYDTPKEMYLAAVENMKKLDNFKMEIMELDHQEYSGYLHNSEEEYDLHFTEGVYTAGEFLCDLKTAEELFYQNVFSDGEMYFLEIEEDKWIASRQFADIEWEKEEEKVVISFTNYMTEEDYPLRKVKAIINKDLLIEEITINDQLSDHDGRIHPNSENRLLFSDYNSRFPYTAWQEYDKAIQKTLRQDFIFRFEEEWNNPGTIKVFEYQADGKTCVRYDGIDMNHLCSYDMEKICRLDFFERGPEKAKFIKGKIQIKNNKKIITGIFRNFSNGVAVRDLCAKICVDEKGRLEKITYDWYDGADHESKKAYYMGEGNITFTYE